MTELFAQQADMRILSGARGAVSSPHKPPTPGSHAAALKDLERRVAPDADMNLRHFDTFIFRVENGGQRPNNSSPIDVWVDNLRLVGPAGEKRLDDFEAGARAEFGCKAGRVVIACCLCRRPNVSEPRLRPHIQGAQISSTRL